LCSWFSIRGADVVNVSAECFETEVVETGEVVALRSHVNLSLVSREEVLECLRDRVLVLGDAPWLAGSSRRFL
jgi:hypothetical protein